MLTLLVFLPLLFAILLPLMGGKEENSFYHKRLHQGATVGAIALLLASLYAFSSGGTSLQETIPLLPSLSVFGITYALGADGLSATLVVLTAFLLLMAVMASYSNITKRLKLYYAMVFTLIAAVIGVFLARDLFLFFLFWELELIPMYMLIAIWGGPRRDFAAMKFVLYTLFGSVFLVVGILALYFAALKAGVPHESLFMFDTAQKLVQSGQLPYAMQLLVFVSLFVTYAVKLPVVPFHTWLPDAHVEAPTPISMLLAGILLKMGSYGMLRFCYGWFPEAAFQAGPWIALLAVINIVYTAGVALVQKDLKKLIAYSSVSHMGFVLLGLAALNATGFNGAVFVMISHGIVSAGLFMCVGTLYLRTHTRQIADYGGFAAQTPVLFYFFLFISMASLGLPLLISFAGESLVLYGSYLSIAFHQMVSFVPGWAILWSMQTVTFLSAIGVVIGAAYLLWMLQRVFFGPLQDNWKTLSDATPSEVLVLASISLLVVAYGFFPNQLVKHFEKDVTSMALPYEQLMLFAVQQPAKQQPLKIPVAAVAVPTTTGHALLQLPPEPKSVTISHTQLQPTQTLPQTATTMTPKVDGEALPQGSETR